ncbi:MAG TPA: DUF664 domain-containing protein [Acidimicrobiia bacterium]|nr:DUF664 domain-containing protein [Acidimicrobiia bacterium]
MFSVEDFLWYVDDAIDGMVAIVTELGDDLANTAIDTPGANSPYVVLTHCLGVMEWWGGYFIAGRAIDRDRDAEFVARGSVADLARRSRAARDQLRADLVAFDPHAPPAGTPAPEWADEPCARTQGGTALHIYRELAQHRGQMEITRDVLLTR